MQIKIIVKLYLAPVRMAIIIENKCGHRVDRRNSYVPLVGRQTVVTAVEVSIEILLLFSMLLGMGCLLKFVFW